MCQFCVIICKKNSILIHASLQEYKLICYPEMVLRFQCNSDGIVLLLSFSRNRVLPEEDVRLYTGNQLLMEITFTGCRLSCSICLLT